MRLLPKIKSNRFTYKYRGETCLNCEHPIDKCDRFCPKCGQKNSTKKISLLDLVQEIFSSFLSYEAKLLQTLKLMFFKPGQLSLEYTNGKRISFTNPFRLFLSISVLFFLVVSLSIDDSLNDIGFFSNDEKTEDSTTYKEDSKLQNSGSDELKTEKTYSKEAVVIKDSLDAEIFQNNTTKKIAWFNKLQEAFKVNKSLSYKEALEQQLIEDNYRGWLTYRFVRGIAKTKKNVAGFLRYLVPKIPLFIFFFIPLFTLLNKLLYFSTNKNFVDHLIFNYNLSSFLLLIYGLFLQIEDSFLEPIGEFVAVLVISGMYFYVYKSLRTFYGQSRFLSVFKTLLIGTFYPLFLSLFLLILIFLSFLFF